MPFDSIETGRVKSASVGDKGDLQVTLTDVPEGELPNCTVHQPLGLMSRPRDGKADAVYAANGDTCEVFNVEDVSARKALAAKAGAGECAKGETRIFSVGDAPNGILLKDNAFKIGTEALKAAVRVDDEVQSGVLSATSADVPPPAPPGTKIVTLIYTDQFGTITPLLAMTFAPPALAAIVTASATVKGKPIAGSNLVKIE
jgi:hypothetical protein